jgi:hypothetical protein
MAVITCASRSVQMLTTAALPLLDGYWIKTDWESVAEVIGESDDTFAKSGLAEHSSSPARHRDWYRNGAWTTRRRRT